jgi:exodeoxyribonuclease VII large subunit
LWAFNEEVVARAIFRSAIPVVSAVGHEIDFSISDFVADVRAATPTEAAEIVVPDRSEVLERLRERRKRLALSLDRAVARGREGLRALASRYAFRRPESLLRDRAQKADDALEKARVLLDHRLRMLDEAVTGAGRRLHALSPLAVLERGYSVTLAQDGRILRSVEGVGQGDTIRSRLHRGEIASVVRDTAGTPPSSMEITERED